MMDITEMTVPKNKIGQQLQVNIWFKIAEILSVFLAGFVLIILLKPLAGDDPVRLLGIIWLANILMLVLVWVGLRLRGEGWDSFGLTFKPLSWRGGIRIFLLSLLVFVIATVLYVLGIIIMANLSEVPQTADMSGYDFLKNNIGMLLISIVAVLIVSSFGEEVIYRGFLINRIEQLGLSRKYNNLIAILLSSIIFGLIHYRWGTAGMVQTFFMGLAMGICYIKLKKRLWILILAHAYMDTILMVQMYMASN